MVFTPFYVFFIVISAIAFTRAVNKRGKMSYNSAGPQPQSKIFTFSSFLYFSKNLSTTLLSRCFVVKTKIIQIKSFIQKYGGGKITSGFIRLKSRLCLDVLIKRI